VLPARLRETIIGSRVLARDIGAVALMTKAFRRADNMALSVEELELAQGVSIASSPSQFFELAGVTHEFCCSIANTSNNNNNNNATHRLGRASSHDLWPALVMPLRDCPQVSVPYVVLVVSETTTRQDIVAAASRVTRRLYLLADSKAHVEQAFSRHDYYRTTFDATLARLLYNPSDQWLRFESLFAQPFEADVAEKPPKRLKAKTRRQAAAMAVEKTASAAPESGLLDEEEDCFAWQDPSMKS
jgi:hypothetical protein